MRTARKKTKDVYTKDEGNNGNGNGNGGEVSEEKMIEVNGTGEMEVILTAEAETESLDTYNYQTSVVDGKCLVIWEFKALVKIENSVEIDVKDPVCESVTEVV